MTAPQRGAVATRDAIVAGETTALAECEAAIARIEAADPALNAVIVKRYDEARAEARAADEALANGQRLPLHGVPMTIKESFQLAGTPATWGFTEHAGNVAATDGSTVRRLKAAGAIILGKTNVPVGLADIQSVNPIYGRTVNPHDASRTSGGSSGGAAAALASGMVPLELGTDIGGSIRTPAHFCGVFGHKSTYGVIPLDGHPFPGTDGADRPLSVAGPMAREARDLAAALDVVTADPLPRPRWEGLAGRRLLLVTQHPLAPLMGAIRDGLEETAARAEAAGATVLRAHPGLPDLAALTTAYMLMLNMIVSNGGPAPDGHKPTVEQWFALCDAQARYERQMAALFEDVDAILMPVHGTTAFPHDDEPDLRQRKLIIDGEETRFAAQFGWIALATFCGLPATSTPIGWHEGLPFGVQVVTARGRDHEAIALAAVAAAQTKPSAKQDRPLASRS